MPYYWDAYYHELAVEFEAKQTRGERASEPLITPGIVAALAAVAMLVAALAPWLG